MGTTYDIYQKQKQYTADIKSVASDYEKQLAGYYGVPDSAAYDPDASYWLRAAGYRPEEIARMSITEARKRALANQMGAMPKNINYEALQKSRWEFAPARQKEKTQAQNIGWEEYYATLNKLSPAAQSYFGQPGAFAEQRRLWETVGGGMTWADYLASQDLSRQFREMPAYQRGSQPSKWSPRLKSISY